MKWTEATLREREQKYRTLFEESFDGLFIISPDGKIIDINQKGVMIFGYDTKEEMLSLDLGQDICANLQDRKRILSLINGQASGEYEIIVNKKNGTKMVALCSLTPEKDKAGRIVSCLGVIRDITAHKEAEEERLAHLRFFENLDRVNQAIQGRNDLEQMIGDVLDVLLSIFDCDRVFLVHPHNLEDSSLVLAMERYRPEFPGASAQGIDIFHYPDIHTAIRILTDSNGPVKRVLGSEYPLPELAQRFGIQSMITMALFPKADKFWIFGLLQCSYPRVWTSEEEKLFQEVGRRLTDALTSLLMYRDLQKSEQKYHCQSVQLRSLAVQVAEAEEMERQHLARELHDQVGQKISTLGLNLSIVKARMPQGVDNRLVSRLEDSLTLVEQIYDSIRDFMTDLRPPVFDDYGLLETLRWYGSQFTRRTSIVVDVDGEEPSPPLLAKVGMALFRIVQEALNNVSKHAQASRVTITLEGDNDTVRIVITDNGNGFNTGSAASFKGQPGWGLLIMNERALAIGGGCQIKSQPGEGTIVTIEISR